MKSEFLSQIDLYLFGNTVHEIRKIYKQAIKINKIGFTYSFFNQVLISNLSTRFTLPPSPKTLEYLEPYIQEYTHVIRKRELIQCYLLQFMNQSENHMDILNLLPPRLLTEFGLTIESKETVQLVEIFKQKPEYEMIKQQEVFKLMGL
tara:strand:+ start:912 stop:1355 length:444 start_codon:yes stop_codon:yes gene_type:complete